MMRIQRLVAGGTMDETGIGIRPFLRVIMHGAIRRHCLDSKCHCRMRFGHARVRCQRILRKQYHRQNQAGNQIQQFMIEEMHAASLEEYFRGNKFCFCITQYP